MQRCLNCGAHHAIAHGSCPRCEKTPVRIDGFPAYAPELAHGGGGFEARYFAELARLEAANFWFRARNAIIEWALRRYVPRFGSLLEVGCGTGFVLSGIAARFPAARLFGSEVFVDGLGHAAQRLPTVELMQMDARRIPFTEEFDVVGAFDVLEHIQEDDEALAQLRQALKPGGTMVLTVPQHAWLWSAADVYAHHERRYEAPELECKVNQAGLRIVRSTSFVTTLLPAMMVSRARQRKVDQHYDPTAELKLHALPNWIFEKFLRLELAGIRAGLNYPVGGSRLVVATRQ